MRPPAAGSTGQRFHGLPPECVIQSASEVSMYHLDSLGNSDPWGN